MAAQVDLLRVKVEEKSRDSFDKATKEKKKKKKRECSPSDDKRERAEKVAKKIKLQHHQQHAQQRAHPPHQQQNSQARNFSKEQAPVQHRHHNNHHNHSAKKELTLTPGWPPRKVTPATAHVPQKTVLPPSPLFTFTPLKVAKAETPNNKPKHIEKDAKLKPKKENAEANVKVGECKKKKGNFNSV